MPLIISDKNIEKLQRGRKARRLNIGPAKSRAERELLKDMNEMWKRILFPATERLKQMIKAGAQPFELANFLDETLATAQAEYNIASDDITWRWLSSTDTDTRARLQRAMQQSLGVGIAAVVDSPGMKILLDAKSMEAANLIKTVPQQYIGEVAQAVVDNLMGRPFKGGDTSLLGRIESVGKVAQSRAKLIARDQTSKLIGSVNRARQESIGLDTYIWRTVKDRRVVGLPGGTYPEGNSVHGNHHIMEGKWCQWADPTLYSTDRGKTWIKRTDEMPKTHPGQDIQCRCHADPVIDVQKILKHTQRL